MSRARAAISTWVASLTYTVATSATALVISPIIVRALGKAEFGIVRSLTEALAYLVLISQGITIALVPRLAATLGRDEREAATRTMAAGMRLYGIAGVVIAALGLMLTPAIGVLLGAETRLRGVAETAWLIAMLGTPLIVFSPLKVLLDVRQRGYVPQFLMTAQALLTAGLAVWLTWAGRGAPGVILANFLGSLFFSAGITLFALRLDRKLVTSAVLARPSGEDWHGVLKLSGPTLVAMLSDRIGVLSDSLVLSGVLGPAAAATLYLTQRLPDLGKSVLFAIGNSIWPALTELHARGEMDAFNRRLVELTRLIVILGVAGQVPVIAYNSDFLQRWLGPGFDGGVGIACAAGFNSILLTLVAFYSNPLVTTGRVGLIAGPALGSAMINLLASVAFSRLFGPIGPLLGTGLAVLIVEAWYVPWQLSRVFGTSRRALLKAVVVPLAWGVPFAGLVLALSRSHRPPGWLGLLGEMAACALAFLAFAAWTILTPEERALWDGRLVGPLMRKLRLRR